MLSVRIAQALFVNLKVATFEKMLLLNNFSFPWVEVEMYGLAIIIHITTSNGKHNRRADQSHQFLSILINFEASFLSVEKEDYCGSAIQNLV